MTTEEERARSRASSARYYEKHKERSYAAARKWVSENPERRKASLAKYHAAHPEVARENRRRRRARLRGAVTEVFSDAEIFERDGWVCGICGQSIDPNLRYPDPASPSLDHIVPLSRDGDHTRTNVQASHLGCNRRKGSREDHL